MKHATSHCVCARNDIGVAISSGVKICLHVRHIWHLVLNFQRKNSNEDPLNACMSNEICIWRFKSIGMRMSWVIRALQLLAYRNKSVHSIYKCPEIEWVKLSKYSLISFGFIFSNSFINHEKSNCYRKKIDGKISACWNCNYFLDFCPFFPFVIWIFGCKFVFLSISFIYV